MITSTQNEKVKLTHTLQIQAKSRRKMGKIVLEGVRLVRDALLRGLQPDYVLYTPQVKDNLDFLSGGGAEPIPVTEEVMAYISDTQQPQGVLAVFPMPHPTLPAQPQRILILDSIRDPGNLGTILRTAGAAGVQAVLLSPTCVDPYNPKALRGGMGAHFRVSIRPMDWEEIARYCDHIPVYLADSSGDQRYDKVDWTNGWALLVGGEAHGAGEEAYALADKRIYIPMAAETESLNAAIAASVILFEARRQMT